ncbi:MAG: POTRA domain-containing protein [Gammaproteobacteria bacterium]
MTAPRHRRAFRSPVAGLLLLAAQLSLGQVSEAPATETNTVSRADLERLGTTIRAVHITVDNVFDLTNPEEDKKLYRWANRVHTPTHDNAIASVLLFHVGEAFSSRQLEESARALRNRGYLAAATVEPHGYDAATNTVEVEVRVRDSWTLAPDVRLSRSGGKNKYTIGISDSNTLGTGKKVTALHSSNVDRNETLLGYTDANVRGSRVTLNIAGADNTDGHRREIEAERPFYSLDTRWSLGGAMLDQQRVDTMYDLGHEIDEFRHDTKLLSLTGGVSGGVVGNLTRRWLFGVASDEDIFLPTAATPVPRVLPQDRKLVYPWIGWQLLVDDYREMSELQDIGRTEDVSLGWNLSATLGFAKRSFGSDRDATLLNTQLQKGWETGGAGRLLLLSAGASTRFERDESRNTQVSVSARYFQRNFEKNLFSVSLSALATQRIDLENQVLIGGDNGLRGYPLRYQAGERSAILNVEQRFFTNWYPWRLFRVGYAVFVDAGRVSGRDPRANPSLGTLYDVGMGLRLSSPRSSGRNVVHIDLAFPLNRTPTIDRSQLVVETRNSF